MSIVTEKKRWKRLYFSKHFSLSLSTSSSSHILSTGARPVFLLDIGKHVRDGLQPSFPREAIGSRIERRASGYGRRGDSRGGGHMQQVVRFSKPIEIDGFPIPWQTLSSELAALRSRGRAYNTPKLLSILQRNRRRGRYETGMSAESRWRGMRELTAFITAFSPCHGFSLRHSLQVIERQAICLPFALIALYTPRSDPLVWATMWLPARTSDWIFPLTLSLNYREYETKQLKFFSAAVTNNNTLIAIIILLLLHNFC